jgi:hypothetical protein
MIVAHSLLIAVIVVMGIAQGTTPHEYTADELPQLVSDFQLQHELFDRAGVLISNGVVNDVVVLRVSAPGGSAGAHDLVIYIDNSSVGMGTAIRFPYELRWSFKGLLEGPHTMLLVFTNAEDEKGLVHLNLTVQH